MSKGFWCHKCAKWVGAYEDSDGDWHCQICLSDDLTLDDNDDIEGDDE